MPRDPSIQKVMVVGSGPIVIGQAAEFDYAGTQACRSLREEGCQVVLINSNPATIMTDTGMADAVYIEPLTVEFAERVIERERPDGSDRLSFYSMHTAMAFQTLGGPRLAVALPVSVGTGGLRVAAGKHWLTDVLVGAGVGALTSRIR